MQNKYLEILNLKPGATKSDVKSAYRRLSKIYHPDVSKNPDAKEKFIAINEAYTFLTDVGPNPQQFTSSAPAYSYDPYVNEYEEYRRKARAHAIKKAREAVRRQTELVKNILKTFNIVAYTIVCFNVLLVLDYYVPPSNKIEKVQKVYRVMENKGKRGGQRHRYDDVIFKNASFRFDQGLIAKTDYNKPAIVYTSLILNVPLFVLFKSPNDETIQLDQSYSVYSTFWILIELILGLFLVYRFVKQTLDSQLTWAIFLLFLAGFQMYIYLKF